ncbi:YbbR-like domain-containing protein [Bradymonas sediminis]|uniref:Uncharacterized protein n=1 Tax=Bradymonas sediminis TaxID=1548548 RepID=A0A2Z4FKK5_9DELT|nr:CdaR family protein [Bradymonas sediminis]AWV89493.1 hypothetical protein DN745_09130 [Bradymonas sediminis]TDP76779.1 YbbR domain-containing protein [Bradymonas sediminis]
MLETVEYILRRVFLQNLHMKMVALLLTLALYLWVSVDREVERTHYIPVRYSVPEQMVLVNAPPHKTGVTIRGKWSDLNQLDATKIKMIRVTIDAGMGTRGQIPLSADMIDLPPGLRAVDIEPNSVQFRLEERRSKVVPIHAKLVGDPPDGYRVGKVSVTPQKITVSGPEQSLVQLTKVSTDPVAIQERTQSFVADAYLRVDDPLVEYRLDKPAQVSVEILTQQVERSFPNIGVEALNADSALVKSIKPATVTLNLRGPKSIMDSLDPDQLLASVDLKGVAPKDARTVEREVQIRNIPGGVELLGKQPQFFRVYLAPRPTEIAADD